MVKQHNDILTILNGDIFTDLDCMNEEKYGLYVPLNFSYQDCNNPPSKDLLKLAGYMNQYFTLLTGHRYLRDCSSLPTYEII